MAKRDTRWIRRRLERVRVHSCSDGTFGIEPVWREPYVVKSKAMEEFMDQELPPGLFTRMATSEEIERLLNAALGYTAPNGGSGRA